MKSSAQFLSPSDAASQLGVSKKALRLYEQRGLITPVRSAAGWRTYGPYEIARAAEIAALRALGLSLAQIARVLDDDARALEPALATHQAALEDRIRDLTSMVAKVRDLRSELSQGEMPSASEIVRLMQRQSEVRVSFDLPWPWGGDWFELSDIRALNYIVGPLGSGKTRLARRLAETLPGAVFIGLERSADGAAAAHARMDADPSLKLRVEETLARLVDDGAIVSEALVALLTGLESEAAAVVVDMVEDGLNHADQEALIAYLRRRKTTSRPLFLLTRSSAILDLPSVGPDEMILFCPANHSRPTRVAPYPGAPCYEAVATSLASPEVRARTEGVIAWNPRAACNTR